MRGGDFGGARSYLVEALAVLGLTGFLGGNLLMEWGIGVKGVAR